jgi:hypothetical protein
LAEVPFPAAGRDKSDRLLGSRPPSHPGRYRSPPTASSCRSSPPNLNAQDYCRGRSPSSALSSLFLLVTIFILPSSAPPGSILIARAVTSPTTTPLPPILTDCSLTISPFISPSISPLVTRIGTKALKVAPRSTMSRPQVNGTCTSASPLITRSPSISAGHSSAPCKIRSRQIVCVPHSLPFLSTVTSPRVRMGSMYRQLTSTSARLTSVPHFGHALLFAERLPLCSCPHSKQRIGRKYPRCPLSLLRATLGSLTPPFTPASPNSPVRTAPPRFAITAPRNPPKAKAADALAWALVSMPSLRAKRPASSSVLGVPSTPSESSTPAETFSSSVLGSFPARILARGLSLPTRILPAEEKSLIPPPPGITFVPPTVGSGFASLSSSSRPCPPRAAPLALTPLANSRRNP